MVPTEPGITPTTDPEPSAGQADTSWGRIWDRLPASFPVYPGSSPIETGIGPASAEVSTDAPVTTVVAFYRGALESAGYATIGVDGPLEDGSQVISSSGSAAGCRIQTSVERLGSLTVVTVLFGAECPFR
jgi:hypothetical protein